MSKDLLFGNFHKMFHSKGSRNFDAGVKINKGSVFERYYTFYLTKISNFMVNHLYTFYRLQNYIRSLFLITCLMNPLTPDFENK